MLSTLTFLSLIHFGVSADPLPTVASVEQNVLAQRRSMKRGHVVLVEKKSSLENQDHEWEFKIWFDGSRNRTDIYYVARSDGQRTGYRQVNARECAEGYYITFADPDEKGLRTAIVVYPRDEADSMPQDLVDPRMVGMYPESVLSLAHGNLESILTNPAREPPKLYEDNWKGTRCYRMEWIELEGGGKVKVWVVPEWGYSLVRLTYDSLRLGKPYSVVLESEVQRVPNSSLWYPRSSTYVVRTEGKLDESATVEVKSVSFNEDLPPDTFSLKGMGIPVGKSISRLSDEGILRWDGEKPVKAENLPTPAKSARMNYWFVGGAILLGALAACAVWRYLSTKKRLLGV